MSRVTILFCLVQIFYVTVSVKRPIVKKVKISLVLSRQVGPFSILLCLTPDDFTRQREKFCCEKVEDER